MSTSIVRAGATLLGLFGLFALTACSDGGSGGPSAASSTGPLSSAASAASTATAEVPAAAPAIPEAEVKKLFDTWLDAQNKGDLQTYLALYAERFEGVRRSGERMARMDRKGWAAARTQLFAKKMVVSVDAVEISSSETTARITFTQTWASGTYKDVGPKLIVVVKDGAGLHIAREEMLASTLQGVKRLPELPLDRFAFVLHDGGLRVVLKESAPASWAAAAPRLLLDRDPYPTAAAVEKSRLPPDMAAWAGKRMRLYGPAGAVCEATLGAFSLVGRVRPHFGEVARWNGQGDSGPRFSNAQKARAAFDLAASARPSGLVLAADVESPEGDCKQALWAQPTSAPESKVAAAAPADAALATLAMEAFRKLPDHAAIQKNSDLPPPWDAAGKPVISVMRHPSGTQLVMVSVNAVRGCVDYENVLTAVFELSGTRLQLAGKPSSFTRPPRSLIDADGDGKLEILFDEWLLRGEAGHDELHGLTIPMLDCDC